MMLPPNKKKAPVERQLDQGQQETHNPHKEAGTMSEAIKTSVPDQWTAYGRTLAVEVDTVPSWELYVDIRNIGASRAEAWISLNRAQAQQLADAINRALAAGGAK